MRVSLNPPAGAPAGAAAALLHEGEVEVHPPVPRTPAAYAAGPPEARFEHTMVTVNNTAYVFGGARKDKTYLAETWRLTADGVQYAFRSRVAVTGGPLPRAATLALLVNTAALADLGLLRPDCADLLFLTEGGAELKFWVDPLPGCGANDTIVWVHAPRGAEALYMYYAAPAAAASAEAHPAEIFSLYEGFEGELYESAGGNWALDDTCDMLQFPAGDAHARAAERRKLSPSSITQQATSRATSSVRKEASATSKRTSSRPCSRSSCSSASSLPCRSRSRR